MPSKLWLLLPLFGAPLATPQADNLPSHEILNYKIEWRLITAGKAQLEWLAHGGTRPGARIHLNVQSVGLVSTLFKVEDEYTGLVDQNGCSQSVQMTTREGNRLRETRITFDGEAKRAFYLERDRVKNVTLQQREIDIPPCVHDVIAGLFALRRQNLDAGQSTEIPISDGKKSAMVKVEAQQREDVKTSAGVFKTMRYEVYLFNDVLFHRPGHLSVWLTDDRRRLPVQIRVRLQVTIGTINLQLEKAE